MRIVMLLNYFNNPLHIYLSHIVYVLENSTQHFLRRNDEDTEYFDGILPKGPYLPCLRMADRALLAG